MYRWVTARAIAQCWALTSMQTALASTPSEMLSSRQQARSDKTLPWLSSPIVRFLAGLLDLSFPSEFGMDCLAGDPKAACHTSTRWQFAVV